MRARTLLLASTLATVVLIVGAMVVGAPGDHVVRRDATAQMPTPRAGPSAHALAVLRAWDRRRAAAWAADDPSAVRALYLPGSRTGRHDVAMLASYHRRGLRVSAMRRQVLAVRLRPSAHGTLSLLVTDRLVGARVTGPAARSTLPRSRPATRRITLRHGRAGWRVVEVYAD